MSELPPDTKTLSLNVHSDDVYRVTRRKFPEFRCIESLEIEAPPSDLLFVLGTLKPKTLRNLRLSLPLFPKPKLDVDFEAQFLERLKKFLQLEYLAFHIVSADNLKTLSSLVDFAARYQSLNINAVKFLSNQKGLKNLYLDVSKYENADLKSLAGLKHLEKVQINCSSTTIENNILFELRRIGFLEPVIVEGTLISIPASWGQPAVFGVRKPDLVSWDVVEPKNDDVLEIVSDDGRILFTGSLLELCPEGKKTAKVQRWFESQLKS